MKQFFKWFSKNYSDGDMSVHRRYTTLYEDLCQ